MKRKIIYALGLISISVLYYFKIKTFINKPTIRMEQAFRAVPVVDTTDTFDLVLDSVYYRYGCEYHTTKAD